jgi:hypothetical protein
MQKSCVNCHNGDEKSPKRNWQEGDLAGVLIINRPLDRDIARTRSGLEGTFLLTGMIAAVFVALCLGYLIRSRLKGLVQKA